MDLNHATGPAEDPIISEFRNAVAQAAPEDVEVTRIPGGFDVVYREELTQRGILMRIDSTFHAVVQCDPMERTFTMEDRGVVQFSSLASLRMSKSGFRGRAYASRTVKALGRLEDGSFSEVDTQRQDTRVLHAAVREPALALGWTEKEPGMAKAGRIVAIVTGAGLVIGGIVVGILALTGAFS